jgi:hypothetical protein
MARAVPTRASVLAALATLASDKEQADAQWAIFQQEEASTLVGLKARRDTLQSQLGQLAELACIEVIDGEPVYIRHDRSGSTYESVTTLPARSARFSSRPHTPFYLSSGAGDHHFYKGGRALEESRAAALAWVLSGILPDWPQEGELGHELPSSVPGL